MKILITNDDGICAEGLTALVAWAKTKGEVLVVAPKLEQSGKSQGIDIHAPFEVIKTEVLGVPAYAVDSTPADCVRFALLGLHERFDLVLSGINRGYNIGKDIAYSGTVGAVYEAVCWGQKAIAVSTCPGATEAAAKQLDTVFDFIDTHRLLEQSGCYNINIPPVSKGFRIARQGASHYSDAFASVGENQYRQVGEYVHCDVGTPLADTECVRNGYISVMPLNVDRTDLRLFESLQYLNTDF